MPRTAQFLSLSLLLSTAAACGGDRAPETMIDDGITTLGGGLGDEDEDEDGDDDDDDAPGMPDDEQLLDLGAADSEGGEDEECASVSADAQPKKLPADIIVVVDNSGSMQDEAGEIQDKLNVFSQQIINSGVDVRVTLISSYPGDGHGICIAPPLGSGGCPQADTNAPLFTHVDSRVNSHDALEQVLDTQQMWAPLTRPEATTHLLVVSDDESNMDALDFLDGFTALGPGFEDVRVHSVVSMQNCAYAASIGDTYIELGAMTGGVVADLCNQDFSPVFDELSTEVIGGSLLPCEFEIPEPPEGENFDPDEVNVELHIDDPNGAVVESIGRVDNPADCANVATGWYYDDPTDPTAIVMCGQTCAGFESLEHDASVEILLGCEGLVAE